jgi:hypothetical protein
MRRSTECSLSIVALGILQPPLDEVDVTLWRLDALLRFFLERMQDVHGLAKAHRVNGPEAKLARWTISSIHKHYL